MHTQASHISLNSIEWKPYLGDFTPFQPDLPPSPADLTPSPPDLPPSPADRSHSLPSRSHSLPSSSHSLPTRSDPRSDSLPPYQISLPSYLVQNVWCGGPASVPTLRAQSMFALRLAPQFPYLVCNIASRQGLMKQEPHQQGRTSH